MIGGTMLLMGVAAMVYIAWWSLEYDDTPDHAPRHGLLAYIVNVAGKASTKSKSKHHGARQRRRGNGHNQHSEQRQSRRSSSNQLDKPDHTTDHNSVGDTGHVVSTVRRRVAVEQRMKGDLRRRAVTYRDFEDIEDELMLEQQRRQTQNQQNSHGRGQRKLRKPQESQSSHKLPSRPNLQRAGSGRRVKR